MGRLPHGGGPVFRFTSGEVVEMEIMLQDLNYVIPSREAICALAAKFSASADRVGKNVVQPKQVWNWFQNRRYAQRTKLIKPPEKSSTTPVPQDDIVSSTNLVDFFSFPSGFISPDTMQMEFEAKSARDNAWYDVSAFIGLRVGETGDLEVRVNFSGFSIEEDEWVNVHKCVRQRSLPCEASECVVVLPGDLVLCFQLGWIHPCCYMPMKVKNRPSILMLMCLMHKDEDMMFVDAVVGSWSDMIMINLRK
ncbi:protein SAWADEE HOMEODOMAIN HOMOLOG 2-like isoform X3 [Dioscorea cayenensis subsp. rotundata]|uniref:Protein SAWADEE HOMEODOMAIN HOMOLOG 2-like isoform X3 n=1 Tax=Dioscorea cayennensis subsp. rotundata TaxID=55577 RepID=A0AB40B6Z3_DIOCR|nr:protein SAWADEE HOMEODOMAIN HOMOLOG 2-like isoform X3 [Dioscorea cayenensis subsp. rotundata]